MTMLASSVRFDSVCRPAPGRVLDGRRVLVVGLRPDGLRTYVAALRRSGATVATADGLESSETTPGGFDALLLAAPGPEEMATARALRRSGYRGLILAVADGSSIALPDLLVFGGIDEVVTSLEPGRLADRIADGLLRARNAKDGNVSPCGFAGL